MASQTAAFEVAVFKVAADAGLRRRRLPQIASADQDHLRRTRRLSPAAHPRLAADPDPDGAADRAANRAN